jgi:hypothetical protein
MKRLDFKASLLLVATMLMVGIATFMSCKKDPLDRSLAAKETIVLDRENVFEDMFTFPAGTKLSIKGKTLEFELPEGYELIMQVADQDGNISVKRIAGTGSITCNCQKGNGSCNPDVFKGKSGCLMLDGCSVCEKTGGKNNDYVILDAQMVNFNRDIQFVLNEEDFQKLEPPKAFIFEDEKVLSYLKKFMSEYNTPEDVLAQENFTSKSESDKYVLVPTNFLDLQILSTLSVEKFAIPALFIGLLLSDEDKSKLENDNKGKFSCKCNSGSDECDYNRKYIPGIGTIHYCDAR